MDVNCSERNCKDQSVYPPIPPDPNVCDIFDIQRVFCEGDTWVDVYQISEFSQEPLFVRVLETGVVTSIQGFFPGGDPLELFWEILKVGGLEPHPEEWEILDEGRNEDDFFILRLQRHNTQGLPLGGGIVTLIFDAEGLYAIEGRLAGALPEIEIGPVTKEELQEENPECIVEGPFLYMPDVMWFPHVELPSEPMVMYALFGSDTAHYINSHGYVVYSCDPPPIPGIIEFYRDFIYQHHIMLSCICRALLVPWMNISVSLLAHYYTTAWPYVHDFVIIGKNNPGKSPLGWPKDWWNEFYTALSYIAYGCGSKYVREPKIVYDHKSSPPAPGYKEDVARKIWFEHLAVMIWFEATCNPSWKIKNLSEDGRKSLCHMKETYDYDEATQYGVFTYTGAIGSFGISHRPFSEYLLLKCKNLIDTSSADKTAANVCDYFRKYFIHKNNVNVAGAYAAWGRNLNPEHVRVFSHKDTKGFHVTWGCWHTTAVLCSLLRQITIPCCHRKGLLPGSHSRIYFIESKKTVFHSDDFYMHGAAPQTMQVDHLEFVTGTHNAPGNQQFAIPADNMFLDEAFVEKYFTKNVFKKECNGVTQRTSGGTKTTPGCKTADEAQWAAYRKHTHFFKSWTWLHWLDMKHLFERDLDAYLIRMDDTDPTKAGTITGYSEDFSLSERDKIICEGFRIVKTHGLHTLLKVSWLKPTAVGTDVQAGNPHKLKPPPGCPHTIP
jgi:hypothetical protein